MIDHEEFLTDHVANPLAVPSQQSGSARSRFKVCVASSGLGHVSRGIEAWAADLGRALARRGVDVSLCKGGGTESRSCEKRIPCLQRESRAVRRLMRLFPRRVFWRMGLGSAYDLEQTSFAPGLIYHLRRTNADIVHVQDPCLARLTQCARALRLIRARTILAHGTEESPDFLKGIEFLQHLAPWHADTARAAGVWRSNWTTIPNFVDTDRFCPGPRNAIRTELGIPSDALVVLCVAAIKRRHKRIDYLLHEFHALTSMHPDLPLWLVVAGGSEDETDALIAEGMALPGGRIRFLVRYPRERIADLYRSADVFVLTSLFEMMPIALLEAQATGLPALIHQHPNLTWATGPGAVPIDMSMPGNLARAVRDLLRDPMLRRSLAAAARGHCVAAFSEPVVIAQIREYYERVHRLTAPMAKDETVLSARGGI